MSRLSLHLLYRVAPLAMLAGMVGVMGTPVQAAPAQTYYVDYQNGNDSSDGLTKSTPWKHAPGMRGCSNNCAAYQTAHPDPLGTTSAGDQFILKGGVTWPNAALSWVWAYGSGTQANPIYFGVDQAWFTGAVWARPILDSQGLLPTPTQGFTGMVRISAYWFIVDNLEFTGFPQLDNTLTGMLALGTSESAKAEVKNCYFHGWSHGGTATQDLMVILSSALLTGNPDMDLRIHHNVWDGDIAKDVAMAYQGSAGHFYNNYVAGVTNGIVASNIAYAWGNTFKDIAVDATNKSCPGSPDGFFSFDCTAHGNSLYTVGPAIIYNNYFENTGGGVTTWIDPADNGTAYVFNNVHVGDLNQSLSISNYELVTGANSGVYAFNNTFQEAIGLSLTGPNFGDKPFLTFVTFRNNHEIAPNTPETQNMVTTFTASNNIYVLSGNPVDVHTVDNATFHVQHIVDNPDIGSRCTARHTLD